MDHSAERTGKERERERERVDNSEKPKMPIAYCRTCAKSEANKTPKDESHRINFVRHLDTNSSPNPFGLM